MIRTEKRLAEDLEKGQYFVSSEKNNKWDFKLSVGEAEVTITTDTGVFEGLSQFPRVNETYRNYKGQTVTCDLGRIDESTKWRYGRSSVNIATDWQRFCNDGHVKIFRDFYGNLLPVKITAKSYKSSNTKPMIISLNFDWTQVGSEDNLFAIETQSLMGSN